MRPWLLDLLTCPACRSDLELAGNTGGNVDEGLLGCISCGRRYPIERGIPRFAPQATDRSHFEVEFTDLSLDDRDLDPRELQEFYFYSRTGTDPDVYQATGGDFYPTELKPDAYRPNPDFFSGKTVLDAGCGPGRFTGLPAAAADRVVGLDVGRHIERARDRWSQAANVDFVQGSLLQPPLKTASFDFVFSVGVLHHTPDPRKGCSRLAELLATGGSMSVWVYPPAYWGGRFRAPISKALHRRISRLPPRRALAFCERRLYPLGRLQAALARRRLTKYLAAPLFLINIPRHPRREVMIATIFDYYGAPIISTHDYPEVADWFREAGFRDVRALPVPTSCYGLNKT